MSKKSRKQSPYNRLLYLQTLGSALVCYESGGGSFATIFGSGKPVAMLAFVSAAPGRSVTKEKLVDLLWPDLTGDAARHALRQTIWSIRKKLGSDTIVTNNGDIRIGSRLSSDREAFLEAVQSVDLERAVQLFGGEYLPGIGSIGLDFEQWVDQERYRLQLIYRRTAEVVVRRRLAEGRFRSALELARRLHDVDGRYLGGWRLLIETLLSSGDHVAAACEADALEERLAADHKQPDPATAAVIRLVKQVPVEWRHPGTRVVHDTVGREREFHTAWSAWNEAQSGRMVHLHIAGGPGMGKTRLLHDLGQRLRATGATTVHVRTNPAERDIELGLAADLAGKIGQLPGATGISPGSARCLVNLNPTLTTFFSSVGQLSEGAHGLRQRSLAIGELFAAVAEEGPIAILIDDLHWSDPGSRQLLEAALGRMVDDRIMVVTTGRDSSSPAFDWPSSRELVLKPFAASDVRSLMATMAPLADLPWVGVVVDAIMRVSGGCPQLVVETIQAAVEGEHLSTGPEGWRCNDPGALERAIEQEKPIQRRIHRLEPALRWLLVTLCAAGRPSPARRVLNAAGRKDEWAFADLGHLERLGLIVQTEHGWTPSHAEVTTRMLEVAPRGMVQTAHRSLAHVLTEHDGSVDALAQAASHWAAAGDRPALMRTFTRWVAAKRRAGDHQDIAALAQEYAAPVAWLIEPSELAEMNPAKAAPAIKRWNPPSPRMPAGQAALLILVGAILGFSAARLLRDAPPVPARGITISDSLFAQEDPQIIPISWEETEDLVRPRDGAIPTEW